MLKVDLNLLRIFLLLFDERSSSKAAVRAGLTQPAMSHALNRLRSAVGDRLFTRGANGLLPTQFALEIEPNIRASINQLDNTLTKTKFDPRSSRRNFMIAIGSYLTELMGPVLISELTEEAPHCQIAFSKSFEHLVERLDRGFIDLALGDFDALPAHLVAETLFVEEMVWVAGPRNRLAGDVGRDTLLSHPRVSVSTASAPFLVSDVEEERGIQQRVVIDPEGRPPGRGHGSYPMRARAYVFDSLTALRVVARTDFVSILPRRLVHTHMTDLGLRILCPETSSRPLRMVSVHSRERKDDLGLSWLLQRVNAIVTREAGAT